MLIVLLSLQFTVTLPNSFCCDLDLDKLLQLSLLLLFTLLIKYLHVAANMMHTVQFI